MTRAMFARVAFAAVLVLGLGALRAEAALGPCTNNAEIGFDADAYCPYGYVKKETDPPVEAVATVAACCKRATDISAFPECTAVTSGGASAVQAMTTDDASWSVQDGNGFTRTVGRFTGMCFSIKIGTADCDPTDKNCCTSKPPAYLQFKVADSSTIDAKCKMSYGTAVANVNSIKRITKWLSVGTVAGTDAANYFNVPITWKKGAKTGTACIYSLASAHVSCPLEDICGVGASAAVPDADGNYDQGCELRLVGRKGAASSACCAPTFSVTSFDSTEENRLASGAPAGQTIELQGV